MRPGAGVAPVGLPAAVRETLQIFWESPFPATLQDEDFRLVDVNDAFLEFSGFDRAALVGRDPSSCSTRKTAPPTARSAGCSRRRAAAPTRRR